MSIQSFTSCLKSDYSNPKEETLLLEEDEKVQTVVSKLEWKEVGQTTIVSRKDNTPIPIYIMKKTSKNMGTTYYKAVLKHEDVANHKFLGELDLYKMRWLDSNKFGYENRENMPDYCIWAYYRKSSSEKLEFQISKIVVSLINASKNKDYKGIGTALMQVAIEKSFNHQYEGRVLLDACWNSHGFYNKIGLKSFTNPRADKAIEEELERAKIEKREPNTEFLGSVTMYLPVEKTEEWKNKIKSAPILSKSKNKVE